MATRSTPPAAASAPSYIVPFITVTILFGIFGFLTNLNSNLMPHLRSIFDLSYGPAMLATTALSVQDVALASGFTSSNTFCRAYRIRFGKSPGSARALK